MLQIFGLLLLSLPSLGAVQGPLGPQDPREEIQRLFQEIKKDLKTVDLLLLEAGTEQAKAKMEEVSSKIEELLKEAHSNQKKISKTIEEILKKIPPSGGGSGPPLPPQDQNPQGQKQERERERTQTPEDPGEVQPQPGKENPRDPLNSEKDPEKYKAPPAKRPPPHRAQRENQQGKWGDLPPLYQELFRNQKTDEIPLRYRRWIEDYYRRMNKASQ